MNGSDLEYLNYIRDQIQAHQSQLTLAGQDPVLKTLLEEKIKLYQDLLVPFQTNVCVEFQHLWVPRALCLVSHWPIFDLMEDYLKSLYWGLMDNNGTAFSLESCLVNLIQEISLPPAGRKEILLQAPLKELFFHRPPPNHLPTLKNVRNLLCFQQISHFLIQCI